MSRYLKYRFTQKSPFFYFSLKTIKTCGYKEHTFIFSEDRPSNSSSEDLKNTSWRKRYKNICWRVSFFWKPVVCGLTAFPFLKVLGWERLLTGLFSTLANWVCMRVYYVFVFVCVRSSVSIQSSIFCAVLRHVDEYDDDDDGDDDEKKAFIQPSSRSVNEPLRGIIDKLFLLLLLVLFLGLLICFIWLFLYLFLQQSISEFVALVCKFCEMISFDK